jgi:acyl-CoA thioester hydrolase
MPSEQDRAPESRGEPAARPPFRFSCPITPRFRDSDAMGHINNAVYITYLEVGRQEYWKRMSDQPDYRQVPFILAHVTCDFRSEALIRETLDVFLRCAWIGGKSFAFAYEIRERQSGRLVVEATTVQVCYDYATKRSIAMPDGLRRALEAFEGRPLSKAVEA